MWLPRREWFSRSFLQSPDGSVTAGWRERTLASQPGRWCLIGRLIGSRRLTATLTGGSAELSRGTAVTCACHADSVTSTWRALRHACAPRGAHSRMCYRRLWPRPFITFYQCYLIKSMSPGATLLDWVQTGRNMCTLIKSQLEGPSKAPQEVKLLDLWCCLFVHEPNQWGRCSLSQDWENTEPAEARCVRSAQANKAKCSLKVSVKQLDFFFFFPR